MAETLVDGLELAGIHGHVAPGTRQDGLGDEVGAGQPVLDAHLRRLMEQDGKEKVILRDVLIGQGGFEVGTLYITHLGPVHLIGMEFITKMVEQAADIAFRHFGVPAAIHMKDKGAQPPVFGFVSEPGTVDTAGDADETVVRLALARLTNFIKELFQFMLAPLVREIGLLQALQCGSTVIAVTLCVEADFRITGIHNAAGTYLIRIVVLHEISV